eukprot:gi/632989867/ref/XP_007883877.1/ PREDICTED: uncharacterized protein LOC103173015 [Callorhinchus milii]
MANKVSLGLSIFLIVLVILISVYQWRLLSENKLLKADLEHLKIHLTKMDDDRQNLLNQKSELSMSLENKKRYISDVDGKFIVMKDELDNKEKSLQDCGDEKGKMKQEIEKLQADVKQTEDNRKAMGDEKQKTVTELEEFRKLCTIVDKKQELAIKLCPPPPVVQPQH